MHGGKQRPQRRVGQGRVASSRMVLDHLPAPMGFVDRNLRVRCINQAGCRIYGYRSQREVLGRTVPETIGAMTYARLRHAVEAALGGETVVIEDIAPDRYGPGLDYISEDHYVPRFGPDRTVVGFDFLSIDVTARRRAEATRQALTRRLLLAHEAERRALAHELHEGVSQALTGLNLWLATADNPDPHVAGAQRLVTGLTERTRRLAVDLRPPELDDFNLLLVLRSFLRRFAQQTGVKVELHAEGGGYYFPDPMQTAAYRIVEEALTNVSRHAGVDFASLDLSVTGTALAITVRDTGSGFDLASAPSGGGLHRMREWAELFGGSLVVEATPAAGVTVTVSLPSP
jgi:PAS domain S-box-containing protein